MVVDAVNADHPHACGDKDSECIMDGYKLGSSPRVWGQGQSFVLSYRINWDHPHACGDKPPLSIDLSMSIGSSPRVWGQACA